MAMAGNPSIRRLRWTAIVALQFCATAFIANGISDINATLTPHTSATSLSLSPEDMCPFLAEDATPPRPAKKPLLITDYEFEHYWYPNMNTLRIGFILELNTPPQKRIETVIRKCLSAMRLAVKDVNEQQMMPGKKESQLVFYAEKKTSCQEPGLTTDSGGAAAIAGAGWGGYRRCSIDFDALRGADDFKREYPSVLLRVETIPSTLVALSSLLQVIKALDWSRITIIYEVEILGYLGLNRLREIVSAQGIHVLDYIPLATPGEKFDPTFSEIEKSIEASDSRIQVVLSSGPDQIRLLRRMKNLGFFDRAHAWLTLNDLEEELALEPDPEAYDGLIMINNGVTLDGYGPYDNFKNEWMALNTTEYPGAGDEVLDSNEAFAYMCVTMLANMYARIIRANITNPRDVTPNHPFIKELKLGMHTSQIKVTDFYRFEPFDGPAGPIEVDRNGDRRNGNYLVSSLQNGKSQQVGEVLNGIYTASMPMPFRKHQRLPNDSSPWAIQNMRWSRVPGTIFGALCVAGLAMTFATAIIVIYFRNHIVIKASSVTVANQSLQTRHLLVYVIATVVISLLPLIAQEIVNPSKPTLLNIRNIQWVKCSPTNGFKIPLYLGSAIIPTLVVLFGVFLAYSTRNVVFLWNEARQIAWVLYNNFFLLVVILIVQTFASDLYMATYYIIIIVSYFGAAFALLVLFIPKIVAIWISMRTERFKSSIGHNWDSSPRQEEHSRTEGIAADTGVSGGGEFGGQPSVANLSGPQSGNADHEKLDGTIYYSTEIPSAAKEMPNMIIHQSTEAALAGHSWIPAPEHPLSPPPRVPLPGANHLGSNMTSTFSTLDLEKVRTNPDSVTATPSPPTRPHFHRVASPPSQTEPDLSDGTNPLRTWMNARLPQKGDLQKPILSPMWSAFHKNSIDGTIGGSGAILENPPSHISPRREQEETIRERGKGFSTIQMNGSLEQHTEAPHGSLPSKPPRAGASKVLESYCFLLPIRCEGTWMTGFFSHWSMATLIVTPEVHSFLAVDSANGRSRSYLMLTMDQIHDAKDPTLRITTVDSGTLLIRFSTQENLDGWRALFSVGEHGDPASYSSYANESPGSFATNPPVVHYPSSFLQNVNNSGIHPGVSNNSLLGGGFPTALNPSEPSWTSSYENGSLFNRSVQHRIWHACRPDKIDTHLPITTEVLKAEMGQEPRAVTPEADSVRGQQRRRQRQRPRPPECQPKRAVSSALTMSRQSTLETMHTRSTPDTMSVQSTPELQEQRVHPLFDTRNEQQTTTTPTYVPTSPQQQPPLRTVAPQQFSTASTVTTPSITPCSSSQFTPETVAQEFSITQAPISGAAPMNDAAPDEDDDEDLYDPEFGFGGGSGGRRRYHRPSLAPSSNLQRSAAAAIPRRGYSGDSTSSSRPSTSQSSTEIPSAAVLSTAATAVAAGWSEVDALSMAMADPTGSFLNENIVSPLQGRNRSSSYHGNGRYRRSDSSSATSPNSSTASSFVSGSSRRGSQGNSLRQESLQALTLLESGTRTSARQPSIDELSKGSRL
ncbi:hypothetical protein EMPS_03218 [Entomortierella parvispora]|uniref:G-protein coupled receptors family 3 profile domain-containing protein n=1 Tax=Entomortierella parvispora TaxID=205924 RepID=A0A9P3LUB4_9FUNG|nr:hypothetical protein EMPS_03218 [Entomortierella parvispora]